MEPACGATWRCGVVRGAQNARRCVVDVARCVKAATDDETAVAETLLSARRGEEVPTWRHR